MGIALPSAKRETSRPVSLVLVHLLRYQSSSAMANISRARSRKRAKGEIRHLLIAPKERGAEVLLSPCLTEQPLNLCVRDESQPVAVTRIERTITEDLSSRNPSTRRRKKRSAIFLPPQVRTSSPSLVVTIELLEMMFTFCSPSLSRN